MVHVSDLGRLAYPLGEYQSSIVNGTHQIYNRAQRLRLVIPRGEHAKVEKNTCCGGSARACLQLGLEGLPQRLCARHNKQIDDVNVEMSCSKPSFLETSLALQLFHCKWECGGFCFVLLLPRRHKACVEVHNTIHGLKSCIGELSGWDMVDVSDLMSAIKFSPDALDTLF